MGKRIMFTGGSGKAGRHVVQYLVERGHQVLNIDTKPLDNPKVRTLITDITDSGQVFNAFTSYMGLHEFDPSLRAQPVDAVVHFAAIPRIMITPDNELFRVNTMGTYNVIEAAVKLGIKKVDHRVERDDLRRRLRQRAEDPAYFPLDEEYDVDPMDSYALSKVINEKTARAFALSAAASTSMRCASATSSSRTNTRATSRNGSPIRPSASASPGATSTRATSARSSTSASRRTASATRSSTPPTTNLVGAADRGAARPFLSRSAGEAEARRIRDAAIPTARSGSCWASRNSTTGANTRRRRSRSQPSLAACLCAAYTDTVMPPST